MDVYPTDAANLKSGTMFNKEIFKIGKTNIDGILIETRDGSSLVEIYVNGKKHGKCSGTDFNKKWESNYKFGKVHETGFLDTAKFKKSYTNYLVTENGYLEETFDYSKLVIKDNYVEYNAIRAKQIVFAEGFGLHNNPYFNNLPLDGTKGELLIIKSENLKLNEIINSSIWILPLGNDLYKVGATYNWEDKTNQKTEEAKLELVTNLKELLNCDFEIIEHLAGVRPTVKDRRPLLGKHYKHNNLFILNGMGTRGVLFAPYLSDKLFQYIENKTELDNEISIERIYKKLFS